MSKQEQEIIPPKGSNLYLDIGNSSIKAAFTDGMALRKPDPSGLRKAEDLVAWINSHAGRFQLIAITSVVQEITEAFTKGLETENYRVLTTGDIPADLLDYGTPDTLGLDRYFGCYGAVTLSRDPVVVIDAGTACTVDYMTGDYIYRGGVITPGLATLETGISESLPALPRVERKVPDRWPGKSTAESLQWGIYGAFRDSLKGILHRYRETFSEFDLFITGGDAQLVGELLQQDSKVRPILVFEGMRQFLEDYI